MRNQGLFNERTRVQLPALVHLTRIGYAYYGRIDERDEGIVFDGKTNILLDVFKKQFMKLNPEFTGSIDQVLNDIRNELDNNDLGRSFYKRLTAESPIKLIDFNDPCKNTFHCTAEFECRNNGEIFRPDITLFVNGLPLVLIEVKIPNNREGIIAERKRLIDTRFPNKKFRRFLNITQLWILSNNMEYDSSGGIEHLNGAFYCTNARKKPFLNYFREENPGGRNIAPFIQNYHYLDIDDDVENRILSSFNMHVIHNNPEYRTNLDFNRPTNRILTSMCSPERLLFLIKYGIAYVKDEREVDGTIESKDEKHIMRYQQMFATLAVRKQISEGKNSGVIWHTQGSGKTALAFFLNHVLTDYLTSQHKVAKFYFIVDRLDLLEQAKQEFEARGLVVKTANTRDELMQQFATNQSLEGVTGDREIVVVNIQRFAEDPTKVEFSSYATNLQRVFIVDEAHRGYNPKGSFLANLLDADKNSIKIALTGTPLLKEERASWKVFGKYYHTYYYDKSISDGYTLKIIREDIETSYKEKLSEIYNNLETLVKKSDIKKEYIVEHETYIKELLKYIIHDLKEFRQIHADCTLGGMIICETSEQARRLYASFAKVQDELNSQEMMPSDFKVGLILYDSDDKEKRKQIVKDFKKNMTIDILIVYNMLLTGFDAPRLKRLYLGRKLKDHGLLQAITRVNRPYKDNRYGFVIDFADIKKNYEEINVAYLKELARFNNPEKTENDFPVDTLTQISESPEIIINRMKQIRQKLFEYTIDNIENFCSQISAIDDRSVLLDLRKDLIDARDYYNMVRVSGDEELRAEYAKLEIHKIPQIIKEIQRHIDNINTQTALYNNDCTMRMVFEAMRGIEFDFNKIGEEELRIVSGGAELEEKKKKLFAMIEDNIDQEDSEFIDLVEALRECFKKHGFAPENMAQYNEYAKLLDDVMQKLTIIQRKNKVLLGKYNGDEKFVRIHKRIREENDERKAKHKRPIINEYEEDLHDFLMKIKMAIDQKVYDKNDILRKDVYFEQTVMEQISQGFRMAGFDINHDDRVFVRDKIVRQYLIQYNTYYVA